jgi:methyl-accepting chemotaxis protein
MKALSFSQKLWFPSILALLCVAGLSTFNAWSQRDLRIAERRNDLANIVDAAYSIVVEYEGLARSGKLTPDQARAEALARLKNFRYGKDGYVTVTDSHAVVIMHPFLPEMTGKNLDNYQDQNGVHVFREVGEVGRNGDGAGFVHYAYPRPGSSTEEPKLMRVRHNAAWDWNLSSGAYIDDIDHAFHASLLHALLSVVLVCAGLAAVVVAINRGLLRQLGGDPAYAATIANRIASGDLGVPVTTRPGDTTSLLHAMGAMQTMLAHTVRTIRSGSDTIASATGDIASGNLDLSSRTEEQASALEQTAASMEELTATVRQTSDNARQANQYAEAAIEASASKITDITGVIGGIAFQTNILALNPAKRCLGGRSRGSCRVAAGAGHATGAGSGRV